MLTNGHISNAELVSPIEYKWFLYSFQVSRGQVTRIPLQHLVVPAVIFCCAHEVPHVRIIFLSVPGGLLNYFDCTSHWTNTNVCTSTKVCALYFQTLFFRISSRFQSQSRTLSWNQKKKATPNYSSHSSQSSCGGYIWHYLTKARRCASPQMSRATFEMHWSSMNLCLSFEWYTISEFHRANILDVWPMNLFHVVLPNQEY